MWRRRAGGKDGGGEAEGLRLGRDGRVGGLEESAGMDGALGGFENEGLAGWKGSRVRSGVDWSRGGEAGDRLLPGASAMRGVALRPGWWVEGTRICEGAGWWKDGGWSDGLGRDGGPL